MVFVFHSAFSFTHSIPSNGQKEFKITTNPHEQRSPAIYQNIVVWQDKRNGNWDIYGFNLLTKEEFSITTNPDDQKHPAIHGDMVVYEDYRNDTNGIYGYSLSTYKEIPISIGEGMKSLPAIYGNIVVWTDPRNGNFNIYGYNLLKKEEFEISTNAEWQMKPAIYNDTVVWEDSRHDDFVIYGYTLSTGEEFRIPINRYFFPFEYNQYNAVIHNDIVVWKEDCFNHIYAYNLKTSKLYRIARSSEGICKFSNVPFFDFWRPALYNNIIIWVDCRHQNEDIYGYNLETKEEIQIVTHESSQRSPAIYEDIIVWQDNRNGNWDIYGLKLIPPYEKALSQTRTRVIFLDYISPCILGSAVLFAAILGGLSIYYIKKVESIQSSVEKSTNFKRDSLQFYLFFLTSFFFGAAGVFYMLYLELFLGYLNLAISVMWGFSFLWVKKTPYVCVYDNEIIIIQPLPSNPQVMNRDTIQEMEIKREPNINMPEYVEFILTSGKKRKIQFSLVTTKDRQPLVKTLEEFMN